MRCPRDGTPLEPLEAGAHALARCPTCRGVLGDRPAIEWLVGASLVSRATSLSLGGLEGASTPRCPRCGGALESVESRGARGREHLACAACGALFLDAETLDGLRASAKVSSERPSRAPAPRERGPIEKSARSGALVRPREERAQAESTSEPTGIEGGSVFAPGPLRELALLALMLGLAWLVGRTTFGENLAFIAHLQFHEIGHALVAWSTGRSALPLPFGFTPWSTERSVLLVSMELLFVGLLVVYGVRERRPLAIGLAALFALVLAIGLRASAEAAEPWILVGGFAGEALLAALAMLAFHARLPSRTRWDFFRWPLALFASIVVATAVPRYLAIGRGDEPLPHGSFVSSQESDGDLERLIAEHGYSEAQLRRAFGDVGLLALFFGIASHPIVLGGRALLARRARRADPSAADDAG